MGLAYFIIFQRMEEGACGEMHDIAHALASYTTLACSWLPRIINKNTDLTCSTWSYILVKFRFNTRVWSGADLTYKHSITITLLLRMLKMAYG